MAAYGGESCAKRLKVDDSARLDIFKKFLTERHKLQILKAAYKSMLDGLSNMNVCILKILECNARSSGAGGFSDASCTALMYETAEANPPMARSYAIGTIFRHGLFILREFLDTDNPGVPEDVMQQEALIKLLIFMTEGIKQGSFQLIAWMTHGYDFFLILWLAEQQPEINTWGKRCKSQ